MTALADEGVSARMTGVTDRTALIEEAACWLAAQPAHQRPRPIVPGLRTLFGLNAGEAVAAIRRANTSPQAGSP